MMKASLRLIANLAIVLVASLLLVEIAAAQEKKSGSDERPATKQAAQKKKRAKKNNGSQLTEKRRQVLEDFVGAHHPELESILKKLRDGQPRKYNEAMKGLDQSVAKLEKVREKSPNRYDRVLENWKLESRIKVAAAQLKLNESEAAREKLESLISDLFDSTMRRLQEDRANLVERLEKIDRRIAEMETDRATIIERRIKSATRSGKRKKEPKK